MGAKRYNWSKLKVAFMRSKFDEVKPFLEHKLGSYTAYMTRRSKGRAKEKEVRLEKAQQTAMADAQAKLAESLQIPNEDLLQMKKDIMDLIDKKLEIMLKRPNITSMKEINTLMGIVKTELGEPTKITNTNVKANVETDLTVSQEDQEKIDRILKKNKK